MNDWLIVPDVLTPFTWGVGVGVLEVRPLIVKFTKKLSINPSYNYNYILSLAIIHYIIVHVQYKYILNTLYIYIQYTHNKK